MKKKVIVYSIMSIPIAIMIMLIVLSSIVWYNVHITDWNKNSKCKLEWYAVPVEQDSVLDGYSVRQLHSLSEDFNVCQYWRVRSFLVDSRSSSFYSRDLELDWKMSTENPYSITGLYLAKRGKHSAVVGYRYYDASDNKIVDAYTIEYFSWWTYEHPNIVRCFMSIEFLYYIL